MNQMAPVLPPVVRVPSQCLPDLSVWRKERRGVEGR